MQHKHKYTVADDPLELSPRDDRPLGQMAQNRPKAPTAFRLASHAAQQTVYLYADRDGVVRGRFNLMNDEACFLNAGYNLLCLGLYRRGLRAEHVQVVTVCVHSHRTRSERGGRTAHL